MQTQFIGENVLITTDWFFAPDGNQFKAIWGKLKAITKIDDIIGFTTHRSNVNWVFEVGNMIIYGCQVKYIVKCDSKPPTTGYLGWTSDAVNGLKTFNVPNSIYISE